MLAIGAVRRPAGTPHWACLSGLLASGRFGCRSDHHDAFRAMVEQLARCDRGMAVGSGVCWHALRRAAAAARCWLTSRLPSAAPAQGLVRHVHPQGI